MSKQVKNKLKHYDYIFTGGGCAALSLVYKMQLAGLLIGKRVLIIDQQKKNANDRTWAFWTKRDTAFESIVNNTWSEIEFRSQFFSSDINLAPYKYQVIRGIDFYKFVLNEISQNKVVEFLQEKVLSIKKQNEQTIVETNSDSFNGDWIFDSRFQAAMIPEGSIFLKQHFKGWVIETAKPCFEMDKVRLFDFRTPQDGVMRFFYIIPYAPNKALIEYTLFSEHLLEERVYDEAIENYIKDVLKIEKWNIVEEEQGVIPMTDYEFPNNPIENIINLGTLAGCSKASTGYTFLRIQKHCDAIVESFARVGEPLRNFNQASRFTLYDMMMLKVLQEDGKHAEKVFSNLFEKNSIERLFGFLDEESSIVEELKLMNTTPKALFVKSFFKIANLRGFKNLVGLNDKFDLLLSSFLIIAFGGGILAHQIPTLIIFSQKITDPLLLFCNLSVLALVLRKYKSSKLFIWFVIGAILTFFIEVIGVSTGKIFGAYEYGNTLRWQWQSVPLVIGLNWMVLIMAALDICKKWLNKTWTPIIAATMVVVFDWVMEPVAIHLDYWHWFGENIPLQNYFAWFIIALIFSVIYQKLKLNTNSMVLKIYFFVQLFFFLMLRLLMNFNV